MLLPSGAQRKDARRRPLRKTARSLIASFWEGAGASCMAGFTTNYIPAYALALKATAQQIGSLTSFPFLASALSQLAAPWIAERLRSRRRPIALFVYLHALMLIPIMLVPYLFVRHQVFFLILFVTLFTGFNTLTGPILSGLMGEYLPSGMRGTYFGWRNRIMIVISTVTSLVAAIVLQHFREDLLYGFFVIFAAAFVFRAASWYFLTLLHEPAFRFDAGQALTFRAFLSTIHSSVLGRFALFVAAMHLTVNAAAPFFTVLMLRELRFSYCVYTVVLSIVTVTQVLTLKRWGVCADRAGNVKVMRFTALLISGLPLLWCINQHPLFLVGAQAISGFAWAGFNLSTGNFAYDATNGQTRIRGIGFLNVLVAIGVAAGALAGGHLAATLPPLGGGRLYTLFFISSIARFLVVLLFLNTVKEVRAVKALTYMQLFLRVTGIRS